MKILHVGDIHLGCTLENLRRNRELEKVFQFLVQRVRDEHIESALFAGDIFNTGSPSNDSTELYYSFLLDLQRAGCRQSVIIAGNHDSADFLEAPRGLLKKMDIHIFGKADAEHPENEVVALGDDDSVAAYVCAVPFIRRADVRGAVPGGESSEEENAALSRCVAAHYRAVYDAALRLRGDRAVPVIGMGHFYAQGSRLSDDGNAVGDLAGIDTGNFPPFDYFALGHLHQRQCVSGHDNWRYAGSLLPMNFRKTPVPTGVFVLDSNDIGHPVEIPLPETCFRTMRIVEGDMETLREKLDELRTIDGEVWVKAVYTGAEKRENWFAELSDPLRESNVRILRSETRRRDGGNGESDGEEIRKLDTLSPTDVFEEHLEKHIGVTDENQKKNLRALFCDACSAVENPAARREEAPRTAAGKAMKFSKLYIRNVNSLYGENLIDFDAPDFSGGIFLISGSTGAGKSSILDAISLALYGCTPRTLLEGKKAISNTRDSVMSHGASDMAAELLFSLGENLYRASFRHARTKRAKTPFSRPEHRLYCNGREVGGKNREIAAEIVALIGMNAEQFTRCVLLAQGSFDAFLKADPASRSEILKAITGTGIYTEIGREIAARYEMIQNEYVLLKDSRDNVTPLPEEKRAALEAEIAATAAKQNAIGEKIAAATAYGTIFKTLVQSRAACETARRAAEAAEKVRQECAPLQRQIDDAKRALQCHDAFETRREMRNALQRIRDAEAAGQKQLPEAEKRCDLAEAAEKIRQKELDALLLKETRDRELFQEIHLLDSQIKNYTEQGVQTDIALKNIEAEYARIERDFAAEEKKFRCLEKEMEAAGKYLQTHSADGALPAKKQEWDFRREKLAGNEKKNREDAEFLTRETRSLDNRRGELIQVLAMRAKEEDCAAGLRREYDAGKAKLSRLLDGRTEEEIRESFAAAGKLDDFFRDGAKRSLFLAEKTPCPLCGSVDHPYCAGGAVPQEAPGIRQIRDALRKVLDEIEAEKKHLAGTEKKQTEIGAKILAADEKIRTLTEAVAAREKELNALAVRLKTETDAAAAEKTALDRDIRETLGVGENVAVPPEAIDARIAQYRHAVQCVETSGDARNHFVKAKTACETMKTQFGKNQANLQETAAFIAGSLRKLRCQRMEKFQDKDPVREEQLLTQTLAACRRGHAACREETVAACTALQHIQQEIARQKQLAEKTRPLLEEAEKAFALQLDRAGFDGESDFTAKYCAPQKLQEMTEILQRADADVRQNKSAFAACENAVRQLEAQLPPGLDCAANTAALTALAAEKRETEKQLAKLQTTRGLDLDARRKLRETEEKLQKLLPLFNDWKILYHHFGSTDSADRFGRIAQGYTFRELLRFANARRPELLRRHFTLVGGKDDPLTLDVIDHFRGDIRRTAKNLSGGEGFEVSLALALGLAEMSAGSQNARLGNVLLDEGFGTLDDDALDGALDLLTHLQKSDRKLVGIISHVGKLREKIAARIEVANAGGVGTLSGAGVATRDAIRRFRQEAPDAEK